MSIKILTGDCRDVLKTLPSDSVHCCVTSPPYWGLRDYGVSGQIGLESTFTEFISEMVKVFREVRRVLRPDGTLWLNLGDSYASTPSGAMASSGLQGGKATQQAFRLATAAKHVPSGLKPKDLCGIPWRVALALQEDGWWLRQDIIWAKPNPMPESVTDRCTKAHEYLFLLTRSARYYFDAEAIKEPFTGNPPGERGLKDKPNNSDRRDGGTVSYRPDSGVRNKRSVWEIDEDEYAQFLEWKRQQPISSSVWKVATSPFPEAHFATFPPALVEPCIKAGSSEKGCCGKCGAPWVRTTERIDSGKRQKMADGWDTGPGGHGTIHRAGREKGEGDVPVMATVTTGWSPSCQCNANVIPCTVLDPFGGAGTTALVADRQQRNSIIIELNPDYAAMAERRVFGDAPLFA